MPTYVYKCPACGNLHEIRRSFTDLDYPEVCTCGQVMKRVPQKIMWYQNPYYTLLEEQDKKYSDWKRRINRR